MSSNACILNGHWELCDLQCLERTSGKYRKLSDRRPNSCLTISSNTYSGVEGVTCISFTPLPISDMHSERLGLILSDLCLFRCCCADGAMMHTSSVRSAGREERAGRVSRESFT